MFFRQKKTVYVEGRSQVNGGFLESVSRAVSGIRVRLASGQQVSMRHTQVVGIVESHDGKLWLRGVGGVEFPDGVTLPEDAVMPAAIEKLKPTSATTAEIQAMPDPQHGQEIFDTTEELWVKYNDIDGKWRTWGGVAIYEEE